MGPHQIGHGAQQETHGAEHGDDEDVGHDALLHVALPQTPCESVVQMTSVEQEREARGQRDGSQVAAG